MKKLSIYLLLAVLVFVVFSCSENTIIGGVNGGFEINHHHCEIEFINKSIEDVNIVTGGFFEGETTPYEKKIFSLPAGEKIKIKYDEINIFPQTEKIVFEISSDENFGKPKKGTTIVPHPYQNGCR